MRVSHSILVTVLDVVIHSWRGTVRRSTQKKKKQLPDVTGNNHHPDLTKFISYVKGVAFASAFFILGWG